MRTLLLADDNVTVQRVIALTFAHEPVRVVTASNGHQAMDLVVVDCPDIVLAGTTLPQVNGYELARFVKSKPESRNVPVLLLSGAFETIDEAQLKSSGANGVIEKPVEPTTVISRVKELLGIKSESDTAAPAAGRLVTPAGVTPENRPAAPFDPTTQTTGGGDPWPLHPPTQTTRDGDPGSLPTVPRVVTSVHLTPVETPREPPAQPADAAEKGDDYLESLESAFDTLDQQLDGRLPAEPRTQRNPSPPLGRAASGDPRSPGKRPSTDATEPGNPVYEVDEDWFAETPEREDARAARRDIVEDLSAPELQPPAAAPASPSVFEVDDEWFADDQKARQAREVEQHQLAAEMGIHEVALPEPVVAEAPQVTTVPKGLAPKVREVHEEQKAYEVRQEPVSHVEPVQHIEQLQQREPERPRQTSIEITEEIEISVEDGGSIAIEPVPRGLPIDWFAMTSSKPARQPDPPAPERAETEAHDAALVELPKVAPIASVAGGAPPGPPGRVADDFAALLAFEQGEKTLPPMIEPIIHAVTPEITPEMLEQIAATVADRLSGTIHVEPQAPDITGEMLKTIAFLVSGHLRDQIHVEPAPPVITDAIVEQLSGLVAERLADRVRVEPKAPEINDEMLERLAFSVADRLKDSVRIAPVAPQITDEMLQRVSESVAEHLKDSIRVEPAIPELNSSMLDQIAGTVAERLTDTVRQSVRVETVAPELSGEMLEHIAQRVSERLQSSLPQAPKPEITNEMLNHVALSVSDRVQALMPAPPPPPQISDEMLDRVAARVADRMQGTFSIDGLRESITATILDTVRAVVSDTSERLVREEIERIKNKTP